MRETELYPPIKTYLEGQGYIVKAEVGAADVVAMRESEEPLIIELKTGFTLTLLHQAIERQSVSDLVYVAIPRGKGRPFLKALKANTRVCRRLGIGLITVRMKDGFVEVHCDPGPYMPRKSKPKTQRLLREFAKRVGDPNEGGQTRRGLMTAYRQDCLRCLAHVHTHGTTKASEIAEATGVEKARDMMAHNHYGWFERDPMLRGHYMASPKGFEAMRDFASEIDALGCGQDTNTGD